MTYYSSLTHVWCADPIILSYPKTIHFMEEKNYVHFEWFWLNEEKSLVNRVIGESNKTETITFLDSLAPLLPNQYVKHIHVLIFVRLSDRIAKFRMDWELFKLTSVLGMGERTKKVLLISVLICCRSVGGSEQRWCVSVRRSGVVLVVSVSNHDGHQLAWHCQGYQELPTLSQSQQRADY